MRTFLPTFCPHPNCRLHCPNPDPTTTTRPLFSRFRRHPSGKQRFLCRHCKRSFSVSRFSCEFRAKRLGLNPHIFHLFTEGLSNRQIARSLSCSESLVRARLTKMSQQAFLFHSQKTAQLQISEPIAFDGLENFAKSQYEPNNINHAIGADSLFIYDFNFAPLNRKGRMSDRQKINKQKLDILLGQIPKSALKRSAHDLFSRLIKRKNPTLNQLTLLTDEHYIYKRALRSLKPQQSKLVDHQTVSSKASRTYKNILFPVNHADLLTRQHIKAFARETISFSKTSGAMVQKYALFMAWKNYLRPQFTKRHKADPSTNRESPAQKLGLTQKLITFGDLFSEKLFRKHHSLNKDWDLFYDAKTPYARRLPQPLSAHN